MSFKNILIITITIVCHKFAHGQQPDTLDLNTNRYAVLNFKITHAYINYSDGSNEEFTRKNEEALLLSLRYLNNKGYELISGVGEDLVFFKSNSDSLKYDYVQLMERNILNGKKSQPNLNEKKKNFYVKYFDWNQVAPKATSQIFGNTEEKISLFNILKFFNQNGYTLVTTFIKSIGDNGDYFYYIFKREVK